MSQDYKLISQRMKTSSESLDKSSMTMEQIMNILKFHQQHSFMLPIEYGKYKCATATLMMKDLRILAPLLKNFHTTEILVLTDDLLFFAERELRDIVDQISALENELTSNNVSSSLPGLRLSYMVQDEEGREPPKQEDLKVTVYSVKNMSEMAFGLQGAIYESNVEQYMIDAVAFAMGDCADAFEHGIAWIKVLDKAVKTQNGFVQKGA